MLLPDFKIRTGNKSLELSLKRIMFSIVRYASNTGKTALPKQQIVKTNDCIGKRVHRGKLYQYTIQYKMVYSGSNNKVLLALQYHPMAAREEHDKITYKNSETFNITQFQ